MCFSVHWLMLQSGAVTNLNQGIIIQESVTSPSRHKADLGYFITIHHNFLTWSVWRCEQAENVINFILPSSCGALGVSYTSSKRGAAGITPYLDVRSKDGWDRSAGSPWGGNEEHKSGWRHQHPPTPVWASQIRGGSTQIWSPGWEYPDLIWCCPKRWGVGGGNTHCLPAVSAARSFHQKLGLGSNQESVSVPQGLQTEEEEEGKQAACAWPQPQDLGHKLGCFKSQQLQCVCRIWETRPSNWKGIQLFKLRLGLCLYLFCL